MEICISITYSPRKLNVIIVSLRKKKEMIYRRIKNHKFSFNRDITWLLLINTCNWLIYERAREVLIFLFLHTLTKVFNKRKLDIIVFENIDQLVCNVKFKNSDINMDTRITIDK